MNEPSSIMGISGVVDKIVQDNMTKLNRLFLGRFVRQDGIINVTVPNYKTLGKLQPWAIQWERVSRKITLTFVNALPVTTLPQQFTVLALNAPLPQILWPTSDVSFFVPLTDTKLLSYILVGGYLNISSKGHVTWSGVTWESGNIVQLFSTPVSYLGN